jgi:hypothetical protein
MLKIIVLKKLNWRENYVGKTQNNTANTPIKRTIATAERVQ